VNLNIEKQKHILVCPLDWGLGHATRCIPLINYFLKCGKRVSIAGNGHSLALLKIEFPEINFFELPNYNIKYPKRGNHFLLKMGLQSNKILKAITKEHRCIRDLVRKNEIDMILSDNRFGCFSKNCRSVFMTHQVNMALPEGMNWFNKINAQLISRFNELWIPDFEGPENLSGKLSHRKNINANYIGVLSRFSRPLGAVKMCYDLLAIVSGPEPQRTMFEEKIRQVMQRSSLKCALLRGIPGNSEKQKFGRIDLWDHLPFQELNGLINKSNVVICRAGYSSIMDLFHLEKRAILVPTPGQTEQEYLALHLNGRHKFSILHQDDLGQYNIDASLQEKEPLHDIFD